MTAAHCFRLLAFLFVTQLAAAKSPNIVVLLADDQGWGDLGVHGHPSIRTPHLDQLARDGAQFERFYVQPVCAPTRAEFLTGRYHLRGGVYDVSEGGERLALREETLADVLRAAGYATGCFGKWHNGTQSPYHPNGRGFDEFYGFTSGHWGSYFDAMMDHNGEVVTGVGYMADDLTDRTIGFMRSAHAADRPFFAYLAFNTPHSPMQVPDAYWESWDDREVPDGHRYAEREDRQHSRAALAMVENLDHNVGRLLTALEEIGAHEDTIVVYFTDNGPNGHRWNGDFKGIKASTDEGGVRSPLFLRWPGKIDAGTRLDGLASAMDLLPTLLELAGISHEPRAPLDGSSWASALRTGGPAPKDRQFFAQWRERVSVREDRFMLDANGVLFDLENDPNQTQPVTSKFPAEAGRLARAIDAWKAEMKTTGAELDPAIVVGHPDARFTPLPARDATLHGELERSNKYPNDSFVRNWRQTSDHLTWNVEVPVAGRFEVELYYTCPSANTGAEMELRWGDASVAATITEADAWDPPEEGAEHDRIPRQESYVKDFRPLTMGVIELAAGKGTLTLHATKLPGKGGPDFRLLNLRRVD